ncbi:MAG: PEGA domain-containing protein [Candidatus Saccharibacteria bacterium]|nr:PEGA domain-containing protein [Candidatus Saccharibacteria bacterium]
MYRKRDRKKELARRTLVYAVMTLSMIGLVITVMFNVMGYRLDLTTRTVEQTGLVQFDSFPKGARVAVDGEDIGTTYAKTTASPGQRQFSMKLKGYEPWQKTLDIRSGTVTFLDYARLVPSERRVTDVWTTTGLAATLFAPDGRSVVGLRIQQDKPVVIWGDLRDTTEFKVWQQPLETAVADTYGETQAHRWQLHQWDSGSRYVVLRHQYTQAGAAAQQWLLLDRDKPDEMVDISKLTGLRLQDVRLVGTSGRELYGLQVDGSLRHIDLGSVAISGPIVRHVESFALHDNDLLVYVARTEQSRVVGVWKKGWSNGRMVQRLRAEQLTIPVQARVSRYFNRDAVAVAAGDMVTVYYGALNDDDTAFSTLLASAKKLAINRPVSDLSFSSNGRFVVARQAAGFVSYDLERQTVSREVKVTAGRPLAWLDGFHVWHIDAAGMMVMQEFDGMNEQPLLEASPEFTAALSADGKWLYGWQRRADGSVVLRRLAMTLP